MSEIDTITIWYGKDDEGRSIAKVDTDNGTSKDELRWVFKQLVKKMDAELLDEIPTLTYGTATFEKGEGNGILE